MAVRLTERGIHAASTPEVATAWSRAMASESRMVKRHKCRAPSIASPAITDSLLSVLRLDYATKPAASRSQLPVVLVHSLSPESPSRRLFYHLNCRMQD